jgi:hypothetical protein
VRPAIEARLEVPRTPLRSSEPDADADAETETETDAESSLRFDRDDPGGDIRRRPHPIERRPDRRIAEQLPPVAGDREILLYAGRDGGPDARVDTAAHYLMAFFALANAPHYGGVAQWVEFSSGGPTHHEV